MTSLTDMIESGLLAENVPLGPLTTYRSGGPARYLIDLPDLDSAVALGVSGLAAEMPVLVLGRGSNLVVADSGFPGLVVRLGEGFTAMECTGTRLTAGAAVHLPRLARFSVDNSVAGLEFFVGIPGTVGGAVRQNAGCFGHETRDRLSAVTIVDLTTGSIDERGPDHLDMSYRSTNLTSTDLVFEARFQGSLGDPAASSVELRKITRWRRDNQPGGTFNAGSVFKNPAHIAAGALIDSLGLKGVTVGGVSVSEKHANFFVAGPDATSDDIVGLVQLVKDRVFQETGTILEPEIQFVGFDT